MKIEELRIGNLVYDTKGDVNTVCLETFVKFNYQIKPIKLTEEWLIKLGFKRMFNYYFIASLKGVSINITLQKTLVAYNFTDCLKELQYVHQLQNLYFSIKNRELPIKEVKSKNK